MYQTPGLSSPPHHASLLMQVKVDFLSTQERAEHQRLLDGFAKGMSLEPSEFQWLEYIRDEAHKRHYKQQEASHLRGRDPLNG